MAERTSGLRSVLSIPAVYELLQQAIGSPNVRREFIEQHVRPKAGDRVLDIGCGPGNLVQYFPDMTYVGVDPSADYIASANRRFGDRGSFAVAGVDDLDPAQLGEFDLVIAKSVLHHIDDSQARKLFAVAARVLTSTGRLVTLDCGYAEGQSAASRFVVGQDRGANIRRVEHYVELAQEAFADVQASVYHNLLRLPYTHVFLGCATPKRADVTQS
jgi:ubiquinone/menaquinone biosynthesis C-methylase UbiE